MTTEEIRQEKKRIRRQVFEKEKELTALYKENADKEIRRRILEMPQYRDAETVFCFVSMKNEIQTRPLLEKVLADGKKLAVPLCVEKGIMQARQISSLSELEEGFYGILEPGKDTPLVPPESIDFAVVPCVSCTREGVRLGHGGGYYDRYFASLSNVFSVLVCRDALIQKEIPCEHFDVRFPVVVSEEFIGEK